ncbi:MAG: four helix bundle protein [Candidatus Magasanikbacteria bacterium CG_4_10_14_0_8_um_filter_32_14]|uniref:Four helix bundle protein n=2 Tax=Candidatus Magasanikiibacteriota TaxID=1752731 RepID=A0A2M7RAB3_9BACT|nr:MAG: four helix bundle protein [Candidatus Magasanikbacteria bacterium CG1_02_32_51]PIY93487.1 MAG: four helix bundle protein [Candidatus Magasanikbacteria bacterium CG_4_10_14_0_8_um_filter_32_14]
MKFDKFEDILAWRKAGELTTQIYSIFRNSKDYGFSDQIRRASVSIMNNIAEGFERQSNKEFSKFLFIAKGSCGEVRSMLYLSLKLSYVTNLQFKNLYAISLEISKMLSGLIKTL